MLKRQTVAVLDGIVRMPAHLHVQIGHGAGQWRQTQHWPAIGGGRSDSKVVSIPTSINGDGDCDSCVDDVDGDGGDDNVDA